MNELTIICDGRLTGPYLVRVEGHYLLCTPTEPTPELRAWVQETREETDGGEELGIWPYLPQE